MRCAKGLRGPADKQTTRVLTGISSFGHSHSDNLIVHQAEIVISILEIQQPAERQRQETTNPDISYTELQRFERKNCSKAELEAS